SAAGDAAASGAAGSAGLARTAADAPSPPGAWSAPDALDVPAAPSGAALARSAAQRIAEQTGGSVETGEGGLRTVHFPSPETPELTPAPFTVSRELSE